MKQGIDAEFEKNYQQSKEATFAAENWQSEQWEKLHNVTVAKDLISGVDLKALQDVGKAISTLPKEMNFHRLVRKIFD